MKGTVLGTLRIEDGDRVVDLPAGQVGRLLELFLLRPDHPFGDDELIAALWDDAPEHDVGRRRLRVTMSRLRSFLGDDDATASPEDLHVTRDGDTYRLTTSPACLDRRRFEEAARLAVASGRADDLDAALAAWGGDPYPTVGWPDVADDERAALSALHQQLVGMRLTNEGGFARTKIRPPITTHLHVERPRLLERLPAPGSGSSLAVVAPAGFGKSTLLAQWAKGFGHAAWMALDDDDGDAARLWSLLTRSLIVAGAIDPTPDSLDATTLPGALGATADLAVVIDDAHVIDEPETTDALVDIVTSLTRAGATVAVGARTVVDPAVIRALGGSVVSAGAEDLRFQMDEVAQLFPDLDRHRCYDVWSSVDGWPIGVVSLVRSGAAVAAGPGSHDMRALSTYVGDEILNALDDDVARFLFDITGLRSFSVSLCDAVTGRGDAADMLDRLRRHGLFLVETAGETDLHSGWYRLHFGVADELRRRAATRVDLDEVRRRAARWCLERGLTAAALDYAVDGGEHSIVASISGDVILDTVLRREVSATTRLLRRIDPTVVAPNYRSHAICTTVALIWSPQEDQIRWSQSRRRMFGDEDPVVLMERARSALDSGDGTLALELAERLEVKFTEEIDESVVDLVPLFRLLANEFPVRAKAIMLATTHDDPMFASTINEVRQSLPLVAAWMYEAWAWVALLDGNERLARSLGEEFLHLRSTIAQGDVLRREQSAIGALIAGTDTADPRRLRRIAAGLEETCDFLQVHGNWVSLATARLVAAHLYRRAEDHAKADEYDGLADASIRTLGDTPMLVALRRRLAVDDSDASLTSLLVWRMTPRQREVLPHLLSGEPLSSIAQRLHISVNTLNGHLHAIYQRLGVSTRAAAVARLASVDLYRFDADADTDADTDTGTDGADRAAAR